VSARTLWRTVCALDEIIPDMGVAALVCGEQIALFRVGKSDQVYALGNRDPFSGANVIARGIIGDIDGKLVVASPIYKQHFGLADGVALEDASVSVPTYPVRVCKGAVQVAVPVASVAASPARARLVMVGNGLAGMRVIEELLRIAPDRYDITIVSAEPFGNYNRIMLSSYLANECSREELSLNEPPWYEAEGIALHVGDEAIAIDRAKRVVMTRLGHALSYDRLLLATGSSANRLSIPGAELEGVMTFRDLGDVEALRHKAKSARHAVVIGGGLLGLEAAHGLQKQGMSVTVVHSKSHLMERQLDAFGAELVMQSLKARGIDFRLGATTALFRGKNRIEQVVLASGEVLSAEIVVLAVGIAPNVGLARKAGLEVRRGICVSDTLQTFDPRIYAVGECCEHRGMTYGIVAPLFEQARVCAAHLAGAGHLAYSGSEPACSLKVTGIEVFQAGSTDVTGSEELIMRDPAACVYKRLVIANSRLAGVILVGDASDGPWYHELILKKHNIAHMRDRLLFGRAHADIPQAA